MKQLQCIVSFFIVWLINSLNENNYDDDTNINDNKYSKWKKFIEYLFKFTEYLFKFTEYLFKFTEYSFEFIKHLLKFIEHIRDRSRVLMFAISI